MDMKTAQALARRYLAPTVVVILLSSGPVAYFVKEYKDLSKEKDALAEKVRLFGEERLRFEHQRIEDERVFLARKNELDQRAFLQQQYDLKYKENLTALQQRAVEDRAVEAKLKQTAALVSESQLAKEAEEKLQKAISEFSGLGIDITSAPPCDRDRRQRYEAAKAKYNEALTLALASNLYLKYSNFFTSYKSGIVFSACRN